MFIPSWILWLLGLAVGLPAGLILVAALFLGFRILWEVIRWP